MHLLKNSDSLTITFHIIIWGMILSLPLIIPGVYHNFFPMSFNLIAGFIHLGIFYFNAYFLYPKLVSRRHWWLYIISLVLLIVFAFSLKHFILKIVFPGTTVTEDMDALLGFPNLLSIVVSIIYKVVLDRINYEKVLKEKQAEQLTSELKFLRSQISPHFIFNVLNNMVSMARHKSDLLEPSLIRLADLIRYMLYESDTQKVHLHREIDYLKSYIELQKIRFDEDVEVRAEMHIQEDDLTIEPMLLIPFVENAFKHGVALTKQPFIYIDLKAEGQNLLFSVKNKFSTEKGESKDRDSGIGLVNVQARLKLLYPNRYRLTISDHNGIFNIHLKLLLS
ncbi:sensor histidine kinase [Galbibacter pacificus]|uniref:Histidine kinase n=1 Tax=Galbibacter pacificus TaxID=2996052 RepID=A0ABT6FR42_9FLAO|nr:histidine kinase [Galbibacter pacificus]MDG3581826.1 histidine kinase [Galbibacter pacificus]MDG3585700.1 histidine kinase [Galbibacter pacificus]